MQPVAIALYSSKTERVPGRPAEADYPIVDRTERIRHRPSRLSAEPCHEDIARAAQILQRGCIVEPGQAAVGRPV